MDTQSGDNTRERLDALHSIVVSLLETLIQAGEARKKSVQDLGDLLISLDRRVVALEKAISKKKARKPTKRKRRA